MKFFNIYTFKRLYRSLSWDFLFCIIILYSYFILLVYVYHVPYDEKIKIQNIQLNHKFVQKMSLYNHNFTCKILSQVNLNTYNFLVRKQLNINVNVYLGVLWIYKNFDWKNSRIKKTNLDNGHIISAEIIIVNDILMSCV